MGTVGTHMIPLLPLEPGLGDWGGPGGLLLPGHPHMPVLEAPALSPPRSGSCSPDVVR